jgi:hypothetical protein
MKKIFFVFLMFFGLNIFASERQCEILKEKLAKPIENEADRQFNLTQLDVEIKSDSNCAKNLLGRLSYEGTNVPKDTDRAYAIFYDLSKANYPPAQYNFAYTLSQKGDVEPQVVIDYLKGVIAGVADKEDYQYLIPKAVNVGDQYLKVQVDPKKYDVKGLTSDFNKFVADYYIQSGNQIIANTKRSRANADAFVGIFSLGLAASMIGSSARVAGSAARASSNPYYINGTPLSALTPSPRFYQMYSPAPGQGLYAVPIY